jgi:deoxyribonuclease-4
MIIGSHVHFGKDQLLGSTKEALSYNANTFMFYTGAPQNTIRSKVDDSYTIEAYKLMKENNMALENIICHAPYIINLANRNESEKYEFSKNFLRGELNRCEELGIKYLVLHPGSAVKHEKSVAIANIIDALNNVLIKEDKVIILLETMAGKGTEIGSNIGEIETIIKGVELSNHLGVCLDTCHLNDSGVDINKFDDYLKVFDKHIGLDKIKCVHVNDSKNELGSHKDRHANIGYGTIGFAALLKVIYNDKLKDVPKILETPYIGDYAPYKYEIEMIRNKIFNPNLEKDVTNN